ncbi:MAG: outer membrane lipoprotein carrier protein LolA [Gemmatimonadota bacterium]|nr:outer membrane lipoprotein carrier protein LolA [Gemmatimonadota bacterium]
MRPILISLTAIFLLIAGPAEKSILAAEPTERSFEQVLRAVDRYYDTLHSIEASFSQLVQVPVLEKSETYHGRLYYLKPHYLRLEYSEPEGQLLVADGRWYWFVMPQPDIMQAMRAPMREDKTSAPCYVLGGKMLEHYTGRLAGTEKRRGIPTYVLDLKPVKPNPYYRTLRAWIDASSFATRAVQYQDESGNYNTFDLFDIEENTPVSPKKFIFEPPPGTQILDTE